MSGNDAFDEETLRGFIEESLENLDGAERLLLEMEQGLQEDAIHAVFRSVHSVKGASGFFGFDNIQALSHAAENLMDRVRLGQVEAGSALADVLLQSIDRLRNMIRSSDFGKGADVGELLESLQAMASGKPGAIAAEDWTGVPQGWSWMSLEAPADESRDALWSKIRRLEEEGKVATRGRASDEQAPFDAVWVLASALPTEECEELLGLSPGKLRVIESGEPGSVPFPAQIPAVEKPANAPEPQVGPAASPASSASASPAASIHPAVKKPEGGESRGAAAKSAPPGNSIRMDTRVLDELLELIGEVVLGRNQFQHLYAQDKSFKSLSQSITKLHQHVIRTRMQPIGTLFEKYQRIVRDLGQKLGKKVILHIEGADIELDRTILEALADPMTHLIRNALDHGIEAPTERSAGGKPVVANLKLKAIHESGQILLQVQDDGRGIDAGRLRSKALEKGILTPEEAGSLDEKTSLELIYHPGFSTKDATSEISGRGVGMDVVRTNLERIGCQLEIQTQVGKGTTFSARIPLTQAIVNSSVISGLVVEVGRFSLALPQVAINEIVRLSAAEALERIQGVAGEEVLRLRDRIIPLVRLENLLEISDAKDSGAPAASFRKGNAAASLLIILQYKHSYFGVPVDKVVGTEEIVVKRIPSLLKSRQVFAGTTVLGDGKVALILDINGMVAKASLQEGFEEGEAFLRHGSQRGVPGRQRIVVFENAPGELFGIPVNLLSEVDRYHRSEIGTLGKKQFIKRHGETLPLLRLEDILPVTPLPETMRDKGIVLVPSRVTFPAGICGRRIVTTLDMGEDLNTRDSDEKGVLGSFFHEGSLINLLDIYSLLHRSDPHKYKDVIPPEISSCRILLAEDQVFFRQLVTHYFRSFGLKDLTVVENGREALDCIYQNPDRFDVIVSDVEMPVMDGYQLVSTLKADPRLKSLPVMALTTLSSEAQIRRGMDEGFDAYEIKIDKEKVIRRLAELYQAVREAKQRPPALEAAP